MEKTSKKVIDDLIENLKISEILARILHDEYLRDAKDIAKLTPEEMNKITSISVEDCRRIIDEARGIMARKAREAEESKAAEEAGEIEVKGGNEGSPEEAVQETEPEPDGTTVQSGE